MRPQKPADSAPLAKDTIQAALRTDILGRALIEVHESIGSTNQRARSLALGDAGEGTLVLAERQTAGRGRLDRVWHSPPGLNLYLSLILRPDLPPARAALLTLAASLALASAVSDVTGLTPDIKWPNDLLLNGRKMSGILSEMELSGSNVAFVILGVGINVNLSLADLPEDLAETVGSLAIASGRTWDRTEALAAFLTRMEEYYLALKAGRVEEILQAYRASCVTLNSRVEYIHKGVRIQGRAIDVNSAGELVVRRADNNQLVTINAGDVSLMKK